MILNIALLALVTLQRLGELWLSNRNTRKLLAQGGREIGASHYPLIVAVHVLWLGALWSLAPSASINDFWLAVFLIFRYASIASIVAGIALPVFAVVWGYPLSVVLFGIAAAAGILFLHRGNLRRLRAGTESRFHLRRSQASA